MEKYLITSLYYRAFSALGADNLEAPKGDFVAPFEKLIQVVNEKGTQEKNKAYLIDAHTYIGFYQYNKNEIAKAKASFQEVLKLDPENESAKSYLEGLK
ncbi:Tetratricopeptide repeat protein [compost metagenome]